VKLVIRHVSRKVHREATRLWHSHHDPIQGERFALGAFVDGVEFVAAVVMGSPPPPFEDGETWEVTRLVCGPAAPKYTASRLLGAAGRVMDAAGVTLQLSYTRIDEPGTCYKAAGWIPVAYGIGRTHTTGNRALRWLPGMYEPSTEIVDRIRWERGDRSPTKTPDVEWNGTRWNRIRIARAA
jgi:hypothetical protein